LAEFGRFSYAPGSWAPTRDERCQNLHCQCASPSGCGTTLPLIISRRHRFNNYEQDRRDATQRVLETVRSIRLVLDAEMLRMTGGLQVLALTNSLRSGDFDSFRRIAIVSSIIWQGRRRAGGGPRRPPIVFLGDAGVAALPPRNNRDIVEKVFATKRPYYSNLFTGGSRKA